MRMLLIVLFLLSGSVAAADLAIGESEASAIRAMRATLTSAPMRVGTPIFCGSLGCIAIA